MRVKIVSLRVLKYYQGSLFLNTNRITTFDPAFKSRIHLALKYSVLEASARKELWKLFISRASKADMKFVVMTNHLTNLQQLI
jgi:hypothetical protein